MIDIINANEPEAMAISVMKSWHLKIVPGAGLTALAGAASHVTPTCRTANACMPYQHQPENDPMVADII